MTSAWRVRRELGVALGLAVVALASGAIFAVPARAGDLEPFARDWRWSVIGSWPGHAGLQAVDLDADGGLELVVSAGADGWPAHYWYILKWNGFGFEQLWTSAELPAALEGLVVVQADADPQLEVVAVAGGAVTLWDGGSLSVERSYAIPMLGIRAIEAGDLDADGEPELVAIDARDLIVLSLSTGDLEGLRFGFGGWDLALGQADPDPALEVAIANDMMVGSLLDGATLETEWGRAAGLGNFVAMGNIDADPEDELLAGWKYEGTLRVFDLGTGLQVLEVEAEYGVSPPILADVDDDGKVEIVYGDYGSIGGVHILNATTGDLEWEVGNASGYYGAVTQVASGDVDGDGVTEVVWGSKGVPEQMGRVFVVDGATHLLEWESRRLGPSFLALTTMDLEGDGETEVVAGTRTFGYTGDLFVTLDSRLEREVKHAVTSHEVGYAGLWRVRAANLDDDPQPEVCQSSGSGYTGGVACYDGVTGALQWQAMFDSWEQAAALEIADVDGDGKSEVVAGVWTDSWYLPWTHVYCYRGDTGSLVWQSADLDPGRYSLLEVKNVDDEPSPEVVVARSQQDLVILQGSSGSVKYGPFPMPVTSLAVARRPGNPVAEIFVGLSDGTVKLIAPTDGETKTLASGLGGVVDALGVGEMNGAGAPEIAAVVGGRALLLDGETGARLWQSGFLSRRAGEYDSLLVAPIDGDGLDDLVVNMHIGVALFITSVRPGLPFTDGFETSSLRRWSRSLPAEP